MSSIGSAGGRRAQRVGLSVLALLGAMLALAGFSSAAFANEAGDIDQCANGPLRAPAACVFDTSWVNGNLNGSKAHYLEDQTVPFRLKLTGLTAGTHTTTIEWDSLKSGRHAYDFITNFNRTEATANPCQDAGFTCSLGDADANGNATTWWTIPQ